MTKKTTKREELRRIDDALEDSILNASPTELREDLAEQGEEAVKVVAEIDAVIVRAKAAAAKLRFDQAKRDFQAFRKRRNIVPLDKEAERTRLHGMKSGAAGNAGEMMMAARKGKGLSASDEDGLVDDLAQLRALEAEDLEAGEE
jgi:hypothetical protein